MSRAARILLAALLVSLPARAAAQDDRAYEGHWACSAVSTDQSTYYLTGAWDGTYYTGEVTTAFAQEVLARHGVAARASCSRATMAGSTLAKVHTDWKAQGPAWRANGKKVVDMAWTFDPATAKLPHLCYGYAQVLKDGKRLGYFYVNQIIRLPGATQAKATRAFDDHLKTLRPGAYFPAAGGCVLLQADPEGQERQLQGTLHMYDTQKPEVIRLEWNYVAPTAADAAATKAADDAPAFYCEMVGQGAKAWFASPVQVADKAWQWEDYTRAWRLYAKNTLKLDLDLFRGACEPGTMKQQLRARAVRKEGFSGQGWTKLQDVDWKYTP